MKATLPRGEAYEFLELGAHLERADTTARLLAVKVPGLRAEPSRRPCTNAWLSSLLKSCGAFEAFRKQDSDELRAARVVAFLLLERRLPRAVALLPRAVPELDPGDLGPRPMRPERAIGRLFAELSFTDLPELDATTVLLLERVHRASLADATDEIAAGYFTTRVVPPGPYAQQQQQQQ